MIFGKRKKDPPPPARPAPRPEPDATPGTGHGRVPEIMLIFHVGMGKTGTTSLQSALEGSADALAAKGAVYLGMWFDFLGPGHVPEGLLDHERIRGFLNRPEDDLKASAEALADYLRAEQARSGAHTFIMSNEIFWAARHMPHPFLDLLEPLVDVRLVAYVRHPANWLRAAYHQWGIKHKGYEGPMKSVSDMGRDLLRLQYGMAERWADRVGRNLEVRDYDRITDVVADFAALFDLDLTAPPARLYARETPGETLLRAAFADGAPGAVRPDDFDLAVGRVPGQTPHRIETLERAAFDTEALQAVLEESAPLLREVAGSLGLSWSDTAIMAAPTREEIDRTLLYQLADIVLRQSRRIAELERQIERTGRTP